MTNETDQLRELARELRQLRSQSPETKEALARWYDHARELVQRLDSQFAQVDLPEEVWHYLHDADLRAKDAAFRQAQNSKIDSLIAGFERGVIPEAESVKISIHPVWLILIPVLVTLGLLYWVAR